MIPPESLLVECVVSRRMVSNSRSSVDVLHVFFSCFFFQLSVTLFLIPPIGDD